MMKRFQNRKGSALLNVLLVLLMLGIIGAGILTVTANNMRQAALTKTYEGDYYDAEAAVNVAVDAVKTATSKEYARLLDDAIKNPSNPEYLTITNQTFFGNIRNSALQMLSTEYKSILSITPSSTYTGTASKMECVFTITATAKEGDVSRSAQATLSVYKMPLATSGGSGQYVDSPLLLSNSISDDKTITIPYGSVYLSKNITFTQNDDTYKVPNNGSIVMQNGTVNSVNVNQRLWPTGIVAKAKQGQGSFTTNMHYVEGSVILEPGNNYDNQIYFVNGDVTFNSKSGYTWHLKNTMIFCTGKMILSNVDQSDSPSDFFFVYSEGGLTVNDSASLQNMILYSNYNSLMYNPNATVHGQIIVDGSTSTFNSSSLKIVFDDAAKKAASYFYGQINGWSFSMDNRPRFDKLPSMGVGVGSGGGPPSVPAEDMTGNQSKITQQ